MFTIWSESAGSALQCEEAAPGRTVCVHHLDLGSTSLRVAEAVRISSLVNGKIIDSQSIENVVYEKSRLHSYSLF
jgi:hypothetical protein